MLVLFFSAIALIIFVFCLKPEGNACLPEESREKTREKKESAQAASGNVVIQRESETEKLSVKLKRIKEDYQKLEEELSQARDDSGAACEELNKVRAGIEKDKSSQENMKKEIYELKDKLVKKDQEYEKEFSLNLNLRKELGEYKQKSEILEKANREMAERLRILEAQNKAYQDELKNLNQEIVELKKKNEDSQWVSKKEYDQLTTLLKDKGDGGKNQDS